MPSNKQEGRYACLGCRAYLIQQQALETAQEVRHLERSAAERPALKGVASAAKALRPRIQVLMDKVDETCCMMRETGCCQILAPPSIAIITSDSAALAHLEHLMLTEGRR